MDEAKTRGAVLTKHLRATAGLTQDELAGLAGVHVRTIRGLESGRIRRPRRQTLDLVGRAVGLDISGQLQFTSAWGLSDAGAVAATDSLPAGNDRAVIDQVRSGSVSPCMPIAVSETVTVGENRRPTTRRTEEVVVALRDAVNVRHIYFEPDDELVDLNRFRLVQTENCFVAREFLDSTSRAKVFEVALDRTLSENDSHVLRYTADFATAWFPDAFTATPPRSDRAIGGFFRPPASYLLEIRFLGPELPRRCAQVFQARPTGVPRKVRPLEISTANSVHIALVNPRPGGHGISWFW